MPSETGVTSVLSHPIIFYGTVGKSFGNEYTNGAHVRMITITAQAKVNSASIGNGGYDVSQNSISIGGFNFISSNTLSGELKLTSSYNFYIDKNAKYLITDISMSGSITLISWQEIDFV